MSWGGLVLNVRARRKFSTRMSAPCARRRKSAAPSSCFMSIAIEPRHSRQPRTRVLVLVLAHAASHCPAPLAARALVRFFD